MKIAYLSVCKNIISLYNQLKFYLQNTSFADIHIDLLFVILKLNHKDLDFSAQKTIKIAFADLDTRLKENLPLLH